MPGKCAECGTQCSQKADDGNYYCDRCWVAWTTSSVPLKAAIQAEKEAKAKAAQAELDRRRASLEAKANADRRAKETCYWQARQRFENRVAEVGLIPTTNAEEGGRREPVVFWGICDVKFDPRLPKEDRVKLLELGDGKTSRFSNHGAIITENFYKSYRMDSNPLKPHIIVDSKKLTHDAFADNGLLHLRPRQRSYLRRYDDTLAARIVADLKVSAGDALVLKLTNRSRGAGVVVCPADRLDSTLQRLLLPPEGRQLEEWMQERLECGLPSDRFTEVLDEQMLHYWSNECPIFVVEELCQSLPIPKSEEEVADERFDATMRVSFVLKRRVSDMTKLDVAWLGGYWKLPAAAISESCQDKMTLESVHDMLVSSFNSEDKRTAAVAEEHLNEVCSALSPALESIFENKTALSASEITSRYAGEPHFCAFALARHGYSVHASGETLKGRKLFERAKTILPKTTANDLAQRSVLSYIDRLLGITHAQRNEWSEAHVHFKRSLQGSPTNATSQYLTGVALHEESKLQEAAQCYLRSIALDPDFRAPCFALGDCWTSLHRFQDAVAACHRALQRQPDAPVAQHIIARAFCGQLLQNHERSDREELRHKALAALEVAKQGAEKRWCTEDDEMESWLRTEDLLPKELHMSSWKFYGWRP